MESGVFSTRELKRLGATDRDIRNSVAAGDLLRERIGWYSTSGADPDVVGAVRAGGVASCCTAFKFHQRTSPVWVPPGDDLHVRFSRGHKRASATVIQCHGYGPQLPTLTAVDSIPVALACAARCVCEEYWIAMCDSVLHNTGWTICELQAAMGVVPRKVISMMSRCNAAAESGSESIARVRLQRAGYTVHVQPPIARDRRRGDLRVGRLLLEIDSEGSHSGQARRRDIGRDRKTLAAGWLTMRIDYREVLYDWDAVLADIADVTQPRRHRIRRPQNYPTPIR